MRSGNATHEEQEGVSATAWVRQGALPHVKVCWSRVLSCKRAGTRHGTARPPNQAQERCAV